jgi:hypothetical protein
MDDRGPTVLIGGVVLLAAAAGIALFFGDRPEPLQQARGREFQQLVGGVGGGPDLDLSHCAYCFDPRMSEGCPANLGPIPGGECFCPEHGCSILEAPTTTVGPIQGP